MKVVLQRVSSASVRVGEEIVGEIGQGILLLAGCQAGDTDADFEWIAAKVSNLRIFPADSPSVVESHFERSLLEIGGGLLAISQFTLMGDVRKGRRPSFSDAMPVEEARSAFEKFVVILRNTGVSVETGRFQAMMDVESINHGPVTLALDSRTRAGG